MEELAKEFDKLDIKKEQQSQVQPEAQTEAPIQKVGVLSDKRMMEHCTTKPHPEAPERIASIMANLRQKGVTNDKDVETMQAIGNDTINLDPIDMNLVLDIHGEDYTDFISGMWPEEEKKRQQIYVNVDTYFNKNSLTAAQIAANAGVKCVDRLQSGDWKSAFAVIRPPGHHSGMKSQPNGFCIINNVAVAAQYAVKKYGLQRVLIVDWDAHHGEGTQSLFYTSKEVLYASMHRFDEETFFPHVKESGPEFIGKDGGLGYNINIGWNILTKQEHKAKKKPKQTCGDEEYVYAFERLLLPIFREYEPQMIFVSAGFDSACGDPLGGLGLSPTGYTYITQQLMKINTKIVALLEGGYDLDIISWGSLTVVKALLGQVAASDEEKVCQLKKEYVPNEVALKAIALTTKYLWELWPVLNSQILIDMEVEKARMSKQKYSCVDEQAKSTTSGSSPTIATANELSKLNNELEDMTLKDKLSTVSEPSHFTKVQSTAASEITQPKSTLGNDPLLTTEPKAQPAPPAYTGMMTRRRAKELQQSNK